MALGEQYYFLGVLNQSRKTKNKNKKKPVLFSLGPPNASLLL
jgi:hypothetical protein